MIDYVPLQRFPGTCKAHDRVVATICQACTVGCGLSVYVKDEGIVDVQGSEDHPTSRGRLCSRGTAFVQGLKHPQRITIPAFRNTLTQSFKSSNSWQNALDQLAEKLRRIRERHSPESLIIGCDPEAGLDFYLSARRFARLWGTPHVYHPLEDPEASARLVRQNPVMPGNRWPDSRCLLLVEADLAVTHPVAFGWALDAQSNGTKLIVVDSRYTTTMSKADHALRIHHGSGNLLGLCLLKYLLEEGHTDKDAVEAAFEPSDNWQESLARLAGDSLEAATGLPSERILDLARYLSDKHPTTIVTGKRIAYAPKYGSWIALAAAMGWIGPSGGGWYPMDEGLPDFYPDTDIEEPPPKSFPTRLGPFPYLQPRDTNENLSFKALIGSGQCLNDFFLPVQRQSPKMDLVVHFGAFPNETCQQAHMVFSAAAWAERDGLFCSNDRSLQWAHRVLPPADASRTGLSFWAGLAQRLGWDEFFPWIRKDGRADRYAFYQWLLKRNPQTAACDLSRLRDKGHLFFWPDDAPLPKDKQPPFFYTQSGRLESPITPEIPRPADEEVNDRDYPLYFQSTRIVSRIGDAGNWWSWTAELEDIEAIQINPATARILGIENGDTVIVDSRQGCLEGRAWISRMVSRRSVWAPRRLPANRVLVHKKGQSGDTALKLLLEDAL